jgi:hypothetical protein
MEKPKFEQNNSEKRGSKRFAYDTSITRDVRLSLGGPSGRLLGWR